VFSGSSASANDEPSFRTRLSGAQEVPVISTRATGDFRATVESNGSSLSFRLRYEGLEGGNVLFAHVHIGQRSVNGGVMFFLCGGGGKPDCPESPATVTGTVVAEDVVGPAGQGISAGEFAKAIRAMRAGNAYANVHTTKFPGGEIRGQVGRGGNDH